MISERADNLIFELELATELNHDGAIRQPRISARLELRDYIAELEAELKNARELIGMTPEPAFPAWIPTSERLPKKDGYYLGYTNTGLVSVHCLVDGHFIVTYSCEHNWLITPTSWILESASSGDVHVTHWMPLPESPEARDERI